MVHLLRQSGPCSVAAASLQRQHCPLRTMHTFMSCSTTAQGMLISQMPGFALGDYAWRTPAFYSLQWRPSRCEIISFGQLAIRFHMQDGGVMAYLG